LKIDLHIHIHIHIHTRTGSHWTLIINSKEKGELHAA
jgi:hypothetical protein